MSTQNQSTIPAIARQEVATFNFFDPVQFETMQRVCKLFSSSELVPDMYRTDLTPVNGIAKNPESKAMANCMIAIEMAQRIGASPLMIMQNMVIIYGRPSWSSKFLIATVNTFGRFNPLQYKFTNKGKLGKIEYVTYEKKWIDGKNGGKGFYKNEPKTEVFDGTLIDNIECVAFTTEKGSTDVLESAPISIGIAIQEGWYTKAGSKWKTMTRQMLMYRAASFWTSAYAPELSMGMKTEDEIRDIEDITYVDVTEKAKEEIKEQANTTTIDLGDSANKEENPKSKESNSSNKQKEDKGGADATTSIPNNTLFESQKGPGF